jgi:hypothetical protein
MSTPLQPFEPDHLIRLVHAQYPQRTDVLRALQLCSSGQWENKHHFDFIGSRQSASVRVVESLVLEDQVEGRIVVDVTVDGRIAGLRFVARVAQQG